MTVRRPAAKIPALPAKAAAGPSKTTAAKPAAPPKATADKASAPAAAKPAAPAAKSTKPAAAQPEPQKTAPSPKPAAPPKPAPAASDSAAAKPATKPTGPFHAKSVRPDGAAPRATSPALAPMVGGALRKRALVTRPASDTPPPPPSASVADYELEAQVGYRIRRAHQRATDIFSQIMAQFDVTPTQFAALAKLHDLGLVSQNHLGRLTGMDPSTILGVVGRLIRQGHVRARPDPADGRLTLLELTTNGRTQIEAMKMVAPKVSEKTLEPLSPKDQKILLELLEKLA